MPPRTNRPRSRSAFRWKALSAFASPIRIIGPDFSAAIIAAGQPHAIEGRGIEMAMLLLAPEGELGQRLTGEGIKEIPDSILPNVRPLLQQFKNSDITQETASGIYQGVVRKIAGDVPTAAIDPRVAQSIEWLRAGREQGIIVGEIAAGVDLSESRFSHLFTEHVRVPFAVTCFGSACATPCTCWPAAAHSLRLHMRPALPTRRI